MSTSCRSASACALCGRDDAFRDGLLAAQRLLERRALADLDAERAVAAQRAGAREHEIAHAGESGEGGRARAERDAEPRHLVQPARDERGARVVAESNAFDDAGGDGHDVLERAAQLDADHVVVGVDAEGRAG